MLEKPAIATTAGVATLGAWILVFRYVPKAIADWSANAAVACWVLMNLLWMLADQYDRPALHGYAMVAVVGSLALVCVALWKGGLDGPALQLFRRFRIRSIARRRHFSG